MHMLPYGLSQLQPCILGYELQNAPAPYFHLLELLFHLLPPTHMTDTSSSSLSLPCAFAYGDLYWIWALQTTCNMAFALHFAFACTHTHGFFHYLGGTGLVPSSITPLLTPKQHLLSHTWDM